MREPLPLLEPTPDGTVLNVPSRATSIDAVVVAADAAFAEAPNASMEICFCCLDSPTMALVSLQCCKKTIHQQCLLGYLSMSSQCLYSCQVLDLAKVLQYEIIDGLLHPP